MTQLDADVIVVGAGPAGSLTALLLARAGLHVLLLDRSSFPRAKACGDCLSAETGALLSRLDLLPLVTALPHARLDGWRIFAPDGSHFAASFRNVQALAVERIHLDHALARAAVAAGAVLHENIRVLDLAAVDGVREVAAVRAGSSRGPVRLRSRFVVGADGLRSVAARRLGAVARPAVTRKFSMTLHVDAALPFDTQGEMHTGDGLCIGVAPVSSPGDRWNVTVVADAARFGRSAAVDQTAFVEHAVRSIPGTMRRIPSAALHAAAPALASGPFDVPTRRVTFPGAALAGDAAGYFDPFTGQGVYHALRAAELLAGEIEAALGGGATLPVLNAYENGIRALSRGSRRLQRLIDVVMTKPALANRAVRRLAHSPLAAGVLLDVTGDITPVRRLLAPDVAFDLLRTRRS
ncbi:MAG TPA: FAD-dependent monooxygenase [Longimicrobiales bacterium]